MNRNKISFSHFLIFPKNKILIIGASFLFLLGFLFFIEQVIHRPCCDATHYMEMSKIYNEEGVLYAKESLRTFAYSWFLSVILKISLLLNLPMLFLVFLVQFFLYWCVAHYIFNSISTTSIKLASAVYIGLCMNVFIMPYLGVTLTDSCYTSLSILFLFALMKFDCVPGGREVPGKYIFWGALILSVTIVIRPAALWLVVPATYCGVRMLIKKNIDIYSFFGLCVAGFMPIYIQIFLNAASFQDVTFLPVENIGGKQIQWGVEYLKYGTWLGGGTMQNFYPSANLINVPKEQVTIFWYIDHFTEATKLIVYKLSGAFDFDYLMPYPYSKPYSKWLASFFSFTILWFGLVTVCYHFFVDKIQALGSRFLPLMIFFSWCALTLVSAIELRFTLPMLTYFIIVDCMFIHFLCRNGSYKIMSAAIVGWIVFVPAFYNMANFIRLQSTVI